MDKLPEKRSLVLLSAALIGCALGVTLIVLLRLTPSDEAVGIVLGVWLTTALGGVVTFWFGSSVGSRSRRDVEPPPRSPPDDG